MIDPTKCEECGRKIEKDSRFCSQECYGSYQAAIEDMENEARDELEAEFAWYCTQHIGIGERQSPEQKALEAEFMALQNKIIERRESGLPCA